MVFEKYLKGYLLRYTRLAIGWASCIHFKVDATVRETTLMIHRRRQARRWDALKGEILAPNNQDWTPFTIIWIIQMSMFSKNFSVWLPYIPND